jgi:hypothetical protein
MSQPACVHAPALLVREPIADTQDHLETRMAEMVAYMKTAETVVLKRQRDLAMRQAQLRMIQAEIDRLAQEIKDRSTQQGPTAG